MVKLHVKQGTEEFIYETKVTASVDAVTREIAVMHNLKTQLSRFCEQLRQLARHGPMKPLDQRGLSEDEIAASVAARTAKSGGAAAGSGSGSGGKDSKSAMVDTKDTKSAVAVGSANPHADPTGMRNGKRKRLR